MQKKTSGTVRLLLLILAASFLFAADVVSQDEIQTISLSRRQAMAMAIHGNIDLRVSALNSSLAETDIQASGAIYNPILSTAANYAQTNVAGQSYGTETIAGSVGVSQQLSTGGSIAVSAYTSPTSAISDPLYDYTDWSSSVGITVFQPLLKNAGKEATERGINQAQFDYDSTLEAFRDDIIQTTFSVISEYNRLYVLYQLQESRQNALDSAQQLLDELSEQPDVKSNPVDLANIKYALSQRQTELIEASRQLNSKEASLRYLLGIKERTHIIPLDPPSREEPMETEVEAIALAIDQRPDLKELRLKLASSELRERVSKRNTWPDLSLTANAGLRGYAQDGNFSDTVNQIGDGKGDYWSAGVSIRFPLGNDLAESEYRRDMIRNEQLKNRIIAAEWKVRDAIEEDNRSLISARLQVMATGKSKLLAEQRFSQYQKNLRKGTGSVKDLLDAENDLIYARNLELNAIENFAYLVARLWKNIGVLLERQNIHIDTTKPDQITQYGKPTPRPEVDQPTIPRGLVSPVTAQQAAVKAVPVTADLPAETEKAKEEAAIKSAEESTQGVDASPPANRTSDHLPYTLQVGEYQASELNAAKKLIKQSGLVPVVTGGLHQERQVVRLLVGEFEKLSAAKKALADLESARIKGFILKNTSLRYDLFAGSFFTLQGAETEQRRLAARGVKLQLRRVSVSLPAYLLTAGSFTTREAAMAGAAELRKKGLTVKILGG